MIGYRSIFDGGLRWRGNQGGILPLSPPYLFRDIDAGRAGLILKANRGVFIRWESDFDCAKELPWWHVIKNTPQSIEELPKKTRYMIRKADLVYEARPVTVEDIRESGYTVYLKAYERYVTHEAILSRNDFLRAVTSLPEETEWWGVFERESHRMVAFSENYVERNVCFYVTMWFEPAAMQDFAGYLLFHRMELHYLQERNFRYVSDGARSLSHDTNIHSFLMTKFNFRKAYANLNVIYRPWLKFAVAAAYPFRDLISRSPWIIFRKASVLLSQEEIVRKCRALA